MLLIYFYFGFLTTLLLLVFIFINFLNNLFAFQLSYNFTCIFFLLIYIYLYFLNFILFVYLFLFLLSYYIYIFLQLYYFFVFLQHYCYTCFINLFPLIYFYFRFLTTLSHHQPYEERSDTTPFTISSLQDKAVKRKQTLMYVRNQSYPSTSLALQGEAVNGKIDPHVHTYVTIHIPKFPPVSTFTASSLQDEALPGIWGVG